MNKGLPSNIEAEKSLLGSVFWSYAALQKACEEMEPPDVITKNCNCKGKISA